MKAGEQVCIARGYIPVTLQNYTKNNCWCSQGYLILTNPDNIFKSVSVQQKCVEQRRVVTVYQFLGGMRSRGKSSPKSKGRSAAEWISSPLLLN